MTIYICTEGSYSDYHIEEVFTDKDQALIYCATHNCELEEYEADAVKLESDKAVMREFGAHFSNDGTLKHLYEQGIVFEHPFRVRPGFAAHTYCTATFPLSTEDEEFVKKAMCDMYAQWKYQRVEKGR